MISWHQRSRNVVIKFDGNAFKELRAMKSLTQQQLADQLSVTKQAVSCWESETHCPNWNQIQRMIQSLGNELFEKKIISITPDKRE
jgi:DNA-binding XRE family transcriptional regulator